MILVCSTLSETPPTEQDREAGLEVSDTASGLAALQEIVSLNLSLGLRAWVWLGHDGPDVRGVWKWFVCQGPEGWHNEERERGWALLEESRARSRLMKSKKSESVSERKKGVRARKDLATS